MHVAPPLWRHPLALLAYALVGAVGCSARSRWLLVQRRRREREYFAQIRDREERLKLALWASGELFWDYDLARGELRSMRDAGRRGQQRRPDISIQTDVEQRHEIHRGRPAARAANA